MEIWNAYEYHGDLIGRHREALRLLNEHDRFRESQILDMKEKAAAGVKEIRQGKTKSFSAEDIKAKGRARVKKVSKK